MAIDCDGSPRSYAPIDSGLPALDYLANAGHTGSWYGLACDSSGQPFIQTASDPHPGYYVSTTALQDHSKSINDPLRYVDSELVCYIVVPGHFPCHLGDLACVEYKGTTITAIVADIGPVNHYGEASIKTASSLGINSNPKHGGVDSGVTYSIYAGSSKGWPRNLEDVEEQMIQLRRNSGNL